jgi:hypothetical protein
LPAITGLKPGVNGMALLVYARFNNALRQYSNHGAKKGMQKRADEIRDRV